MSFKRPLGHGRQLSNVKRNLEPDCMSYPYYDRYKNSNDRINNFKHKHINSCCYDKPEICSVWMFIIGHISKNDIQMRMILCAMDRVFIEEQFEV